MVRPIGADVVEEVTALRRCLMEKGGRSQKSFRVVLPIVDGNKRPRVTPIFTSCNDPLFICRRFNMNAADQDEINSKIRGGQFGQLASNSERQRNALLNGGHF